MDGVSDLPWKEPTRTDSGDFNSSKIVLFDLETSGFKAAEICQIAAASGTQTFNVYTVPTWICPSASAVTGLQVHARKMFLNDKQLRTVPRAVALSSFISFLDNIGGDIILVAHNGFRFDAPLILREMQQAGLLPKFITVVKGFADTLHIFREHLQERQKEKKSFSQSALAIDFLGEAAVEGAHDASIDIKILGELIVAIGISDESLKNSSKTTLQMIREQEIKDEHAANKEVLRCLKPAVSIGMISKIAKANISMTILEDVFRDGGEDGIKMLLGEDIGGRPRVTKNTRVVKGVIEQLKWLLEGECF